MADGSRERRRRILVLGAGAAQLGLLQAARAHGLFVLAADGDHHAPGLGLADRHAVVSAEDERAVERLAASERVDGLIAPGIDWPVAVAARVAARLGLPHPISPATAALAVSKQRQRERFAAAGVPQPRWKLAGAEGELGFPCVVKAPDRQGQRGLSLAREEGELAGAIATATEASRTGVALLEELVEGPEVTVNAFVARGRFVPLTVTDRDVAGGAAFGVALAHAWPSRLAPAHVGAAVDAARSAADALGIGDGPTYTQVLVGRKGPRVVELAARLGGGHDAELCLAALRVDLNGLALAAALGERIDGEALMPAPVVGGACVRFLVAPAGEVAGVDGVDAAAARRGVAAAVVYREPPRRFPELRRGGDRAGFVLAVGPSRAAALDRARGAVELIRFLPGGVAASAGRA